MDLVLDELVGTFQEFSSNDDYRCSTVTHFTILLLSQLDQHFTSGVFHFEQLKNSGTVVGDCNILCKYKKRSGWFLNRLIPLKSTLTPISSTSILSKPTGPKELLTILAIEAAASTTHTSQLICQMTRQKKKTATCLHLPLLARTS